jgi:hypothetical protein
MPEGDKPSFRDEFIFFLTVQFIFAFSNPIRRTAPIQSPLTTHKGMWRIYCADAVIAGLINMYSS